MKKIIPLLLLLAATVTWSQNSTAAALTLTKVLGTGTVGLSSGNVVTTTSTTSLLGVLPVLDTYTLSVANDANVTFDYNPNLLIPTTIGLDASVLPLEVQVLINLSNHFTAFLLAGDYLLKVTTLLPLNTAYQLTISVAAAQTPIPAAIWLFGSALLGLVSFTRRKTGVLQSA